MSGRARTSLVMAATGTILLFYVIALVAGVLLAVIVLVLLATMIGAARVGMAGYLRKPVSQHTELLRILARSFWLRSAPSYHVPLHRTDAPALFALLDDLSRRLGVDMPSEVRLEMHANAWVRLEGYRQGRGRTVLGVGYDLLAGLSEAQVRAVLAHEMAHARLVERGLSRWLNQGLGRLIALTSQLSDHAASYRRANYRSQVGELLASWFDALTRRAARLVATYSRQNEFEADRGAAGICGGAVMRSSLVRINAIDDVVARLPWNERLARVELAESFSQWLVEEIDRLVRGNSGHVAAHAHDPYSTHPTLHDRLLALPPDAGEPVDDRPGIALLANPDAVAEQVTTEIARIVAEQEQKDTKTIARWTRKRLGRGRARPLQWLGILMVAGALFVAIAAFSDGSPLELLVTAGFFAAGSGLIQFGRYRDSAPLAIPQYGTLTNERPADETREQLVAAEEKIVAELQRTSYGSSRKRDTIETLVGHSFAALATRDYLRAHVAARLALELDKKSPAAAIGYAVAASGLGNRQQTVRTLPAIKISTGLRTPNSQWGTAWALVMLGEWEMAEGMLALMLRSNPNQPTFLSLLALAQLNRGKLQSGIRNAERACDIEPTNPHHMKLLIGALLTAGQIHAAERRLDGLGSAAAADVDHMLSRVRLSLMRSRIEDARTWAQRVRDADAKWTITLGALFETARFDADASAVYADALVESFYPEAYVGLARIAAHRGDREAARRHLLSALNVERPVPPNARSAVSLFQEIIARLNALEERVHCQAWIAKFPQGTLAALAGHSLIVCAPDRQSAEARLQTIVSAMAPEAAVDVSTLEWTDAPKDQQPVRPIQPGVQSVV